MAKKVKKIVSKKVEKNIDWKFLIILAVLVVIGLGVFSIYRGLAAQYPEFYWTDFGINFAASQTETRNGGKNKNGGTNAIDESGGTGMSADRFNQMMNQRREKERQLDAEPTKGTTQNVNPTAGQ